MLQTLVAFLDLFSVPGPQSPVRPNLLHLNTRLSHPNLIIAPSFVHSFIHSFTGVGTNATKHITLFRVLTLCNCLSLPLVFVGKRSPRARFHRCMRLPVFQQPTLYEWVMKMSEGRLCSDGFIFSFEGVGQRWERRGNSARL